MTRARNLGEVGGLTYISAVGDKIGIGITNPTSKLHVSGDVNITGVTTASRLISTVATGTAPLTVSSTTVVTNLNADFLDGVQGGSYLRSDAADNKTSGNLTFNDSVYALFGTGSDLSIGHNASHSFIDVQNGATGDLYIRNNRTSGSIYLQADDSGGILRTVFAATGAASAAELYYQGSKKFETTNTGVVITGIATATTFSGSGASLTGVPISTGISGLGANVATFLATPSSANLAAAVTNETGSGSLVFANTPTLVTPNIGAATGTSLNLSSVSIASSFTSSLTNGNQTYAGQHLVNAPFYNTFSQTGSQYQAIVKGRCTGSSTTDIMSFGNLHNTDGSQQFVFHRIRSNGTNSVQYLLSGSSGTIWHSGNDGAGSGLDADLLDGENLVDNASTANTVVGRDASGNITANRFASTVATGTAPLTVSSTTVVTNLNADLVDGYNVGTSGATIPLMNGSNTWSNTNTFSGTDNGIVVSSTNNTNDVWAGGLEIREVSFVGNTNTTSAYAPAITFHWSNVAAAAIKMYADGSIRIIAQGSTGSSYRDTYVASLIATGNVTAYSSDRRLKENFKHIETPLEKIQKLNGYTFDWKEKVKELGFTPALEKNDIGLIAQEVQEVLPQAVVFAPFDQEWNGEKSVSKSGEDYLTVQYERLVPLLVEAIKEQQNHINTLKEEINNLKK